MRITKSQLRRVIREFLEAEHPTDVEPVEDVWAGCPEAGNLELSIDHSKAAKSEPVTNYSEMLPPAEPVLSREHRIRAKQGYLRNLARRRAVLRK